ncbi:MAG: PD-(D/E)XK nuclease family protein [Halobacteriales archaeon]
MPISRAKSVDRLYEDCRDHDLVLVRDQPLGTALTRRLEAPHFGPFAVRPRRMLAGRRERDEGRTAFIQVVRETDLSWKEAAYAIGNVLQCWEHQGAPEAILEYPPYANTATETVLDVIRDLELTSTRLSEDRIEDDRSVAVIGHDRFTPLERSVIPPDATRISPFSDASFDLPPFRIFDSRAAIVDAVLDSVTEENADDVAVVLDRGSQFSSLIEAALEEASIPYYGGPGFNDDPDHRAFLQLLRVSLSGSNVQIADVRPVLTRLGASVDIDHDAKRLHQVDVPAVSWLREFCNSIGGRTYASALDAFESEARADLDRFENELETLDLLEEPVTSTNLDNLEFYLQRYEVPVEREDDGVLLADAKSAAYVDRPAVFYLGLDEGWSHDPPRRPWVDRAAEFQRNLQQFQLLLQNGREQYYLVQDERGGRPVTPCLYFNELLEESIERFSDLNPERHTRTFLPTGDGFDSEPVDVSPEAVETVSQSSLNTFVNSPRDYQFGQLVDSPDRDYLTVGNLFHDFAECYVNHPDRFDDERLGQVVELMLDVTRAFDRDVDQPVNRTRYRTGLETIVEFLEEHPPVGADFLTPDTGWGRNEVAHQLGLDIETPHTEYWFEDADLGMKGKIDLVLNPTHLVDYKSGSKDSTYQVVSQAALDDPHDKPSFQAPLYLAYLRSKRPGERLQFTFFHFTGTLDDLVTGEAALDECLTTVTYHPVEFEDHIGSRAVFDELEDEAPNDCTKTFVQADFETYREIIEAHPFPDTRDSEELLDSELGQALLQSLRVQVGEYQYVEKGGAQALRYLRDVRDNHFFADDLDAFEAFVEGRLDELNRYRAGEARFPVEGPGGEPNWRRVDHRDMLLEGDD